MGKNNPVQFACCSGHLRDRHEPDYSNTYRTLTGQGVYGYWTVIFFFIQNTQNTLQSILYEIKKCKIISFAHKM